MRTEGKEQRRTSPGLSKQSLFAEAAPKRSGEYERGIDQVELLLDDKGVCKMDGNARREEGYKSRRRRSGWTVGGQWNGMREL